MNSKKTSKSFGARATWLLGAAALPLIAIGCGADDEPVATAPAVMVLSPADGAEVQSPVTFEFEFENLKAAASGEVVDGEGHMHILVNTDCIQKGIVIPGPDETFIHWGDGALSKEVELPVGTHTLCLQAADGLHQALDVTQEITIDVVE